MKGTIPRKADKPHDVGGACFANEIRGVENEKKPPPTVSAAQYRVRYVTFAAKT